MKRRNFFTIILPILSLYCILSHNLNVLLYLNGINPCIEHLYMVLKYMEFNFMKGSRKETIKFSDDSKYGALILGQS